jgi:hypothetical protein
LPILVGKRQVNIPADIAAKHNIVEEDVLRNGSNAKGLRDGLWDIGTRGMDELITARRELKATGGKVDPGNVMPLFLSVVSLLTLLPTFAPPYTPLCRTVTARRMELIIGPRRKISKTPRSTRFRRLPPRPTETRLETRPKYLVGISAG